MKKGEDRMRSILKSVFSVGVAVAGLALGAAAAMAQEVTLKVHHFLPPKATTHAKVLVPWKAAVEEQSGGRIAVQIFPAMQLGGKPPQLMDQARDGVADIVWALPGYSPGRFPKVSVFELPFMVSDATATSQAIQEFYETHAMDEFAEYKVLMFHTHARGLFHMVKQPIKSVDDFKGLQIRAPNRGIGTALEAMGASPIFMPVPALPEALSKGVIDGAVIPWEIVPALKIHELAPNHTRTPGARGLYTAVFVYAMNKDKYDGLPDDLKKVIDDNSGMAMAKSIGEAWDEAENPGLGLATKRGNPIIDMSAEEIAKMREMTKSVTEQWITDRGAEGQKLYDAATALLDKYSK